MFLSQLQPAEPTLSHIQQLYIWTVCFPKFHPNAIFPSTSMSRSPECSLEFILCAHFSCFSCVLHNLHVWRH